MDYSKIYQLYKTNSKRIYINEMFFSLESAKDALAEKNNQEYLILELDPKYINFDILLGFIRKVMVNNSYDYSFLYTKLKTLHENIKEIQ